MKNLLLSLSLAAVAVLAFSPAPLLAGDCDAGHAGAGAKDIVDTAVGAGSFKTLVTAVKAAGLVDTLKGKGPFTVLAPTDAAFAKIPSDTLNAVIADKAKLTSILTYHVLPGRVLSSDLSVGTVTVKTVQGQMIKVTRTEDGKVMVNGATVQTADIEAANGVIHVIDSVVMPK